MVIKLLLTFTLVKDIITLTKINIVNPLETFDEFVDDLLSSDVNLLKSELDFLIMQHLFNSIDLEVIKKTDVIDNDSLAA